MNKKAKNKSVPCFDMQFIQHKHYVGVAAAGAGGVLCIGRSQPFRIRKGEYQLLHSHQRRHEGERYTEVAEKTG